MIFKGNAILSQEKTSQYYSFKRSAIIGTLHRFKKGSKERGEIWNQLASNLNGIPDSGLNTTQCGVCIQYDKLIEDFVQKEREKKKATGIDADYDELD